MTLETNEELLLTMLFFGLRLFSPPSFEGNPATAGFHSPRTGTDVLCRGGAALPLLLSLLLLLFRLPTLISDSFTPDVGGLSSVESGFGFTMGASDGCGGGVAKCKSSLRIYVPIIQIDPFSNGQALPLLQSVHTFSNLQGTAALWVTNDIGSLNDGHNHAVRSTGRIGNWRRVPGRWWGQNATIGISFVEQ